MIHGSCSTSLEDLSVIPYSITSIPRTNTFSILPSFSTLFSPRVDSSQPDQPTHERGQASKTYRKEETGIAKASEVGHRRHQSSWCVSSWTNGRIVMFESRTDPLFSDAAEDAVPVPTPFRGGERVEARSVSMRAGVRSIAQFPR